MPIGVSLHIGLDAVDPSQYKGQSYVLKGAENDAYEMYQLARRYKFEAQPPLLGRNATCKAVVDSITDAAGRLTSGDIFMLTFAGHGARIPGDQPGDESKDQTWALYDRMLIDDELYALWTTFRPGVRILVISDSCYAGSILMALRLRLKMDVIPSELLDEPPVRVRVIPSYEAAAIYEAHSDMYLSLQKAAAAFRDNPVTATVLLLAACQGWQQAQDGDPNGLFTEHLLAVLQRGFRADYITFLNAVHKRVTAVNPYQSPTRMLIGVPNPAFENSPVFSI